MAFENCFETKVSKISIGSETSWCNFNSLENSHLLLDIRGHGLNQFED